MTDHLNTDHLNTDHLNTDQLSTGRDPAADHPNGSRPDTARAGGLLGVLAGIVSDASDGELSAAELLADADTPFVALGIGSLAQLRLVDAVETRYEVFLDLDGDGDFLRSLAALAEHLTTEHGIEDHAADGNAAEDHAADGNAGDEHGVPQAGAGAG
ncbi:acyl carrier protein [Kitasatospora sp. RG8]|uniref:acyl carrier protein n=1 Tax=Kitasatospora sp. RG8 TaxID=2820815 RepID=UPI001ADFBAB5|nr:acyl carrier protein [Kitasatospora sp. RG8]MBP0454258.1 acyl carrier protein [Kitasatospora sp. RG8]